MTMATSSEKTLAEELETFRFQLVNRFSTSNPRLSGELVEHGGATEIHFQVEDDRLAKAITIIVRQEVSAAHAFLPRRYSLFHADGTVVKSGTVALDRLSAYSLFHMAAGWLIGQLYLK